MRIMKLAGVALMFVAIISFFVFGDQLGESEIARLQAPAAETVETPGAGKTDEPTATPTHTPTPTPTDTPTITPTPTNTPTPEPTGIDTVAPQILSIELAQSDVDTTATSQPVTITVRITDDLSGLQRALLRFEPASGGTQFVAIMIDAGHRVSGDRRDGVYAASALLPKYAVHGRWYLSEVAVIDNANNGEQSAWPVQGDVPAAAASAQLLYFVNGEDDGALPPTATVEPEPVPAEVEATPWANELMLPAVGN